MFVELFECEVLSEVVEESCEAVDVSGPLVVRYCISRGVDGLWYSYGGRYVARFCLESMLFSSWGKVHALSVWHRAPSRLPLADKHAYLSLVFSYDVADV